MANGNGNGKEWLGPRLTTSHETARFKIGGVDIDVPALNLFVMQSIKGELLTLGPDLDWITYATNVVHIAYVALKDAHPEMQISENDLLKACSLAEMRELPDAMNRLLDVSGFSATSPETPAVNPSVENPSPGIGISLDSSLNLQPMESATETQSLLDEPTP